MKLSSLVRCGVDIRGVVRRQKPDDSVVIVFVNALTGERMFMGGGRQGSVPLRVEELDRGYITVTPDYRIEVSRRLREEYENGRYYYPFDGRKLQRMPSNPSGYPARDLLTWHNEHIFKE